MGELWCGESWCGEVVEWKSCGGGSCNVREFLYEKVAARGSVAVVTIYCVFNEFTFSAFSAKNLLIQKFTEAEPFFYDLLAI